MSQGVSQFQHYMSVDRFLTSHGYGDVQKWLLDGHTEWATVLANFGSNVLIVAPTHRQLKFIGTRLREAIDQSEFAEGVKFRPMVQEIEFPSGGKIFLVSESNIESVRGVRFAGIFIV